MLQFSGKNHREIGERIGEYHAREEIPLGKAEIDEDLFRSQLDIYERHCPELLEEYSACAVAAGYPEKDFLRRRIADEISWYLRTVGPKRGCSIVGVRTPAGLAVARNYDWAPPALESFEVYRVSNGSRHDCICISDMDVGCSGDIPYRGFYSEDSVNDEGLYVGLTFAYGEHRRPGISSTDVLRLLTERCSTVAEALDLFDVLPLGCPKNYFLSDAGGAMAVVEHAVTEFRVLLPEDGVLFQTNHYLHPDLAGLDAVRAHSPNTTSFRRAEYLRENIRTGAVSDAAQLHGILCAKDAPTLQHQDAMCTIWSLEMTMEQRDYRLHTRLLGDNPQSETISF